MNEKLDKSMSYLKERNLYILDNSFKPTNSSCTDVSITFARYRREVLAQPFPAVIRKRK
jgi:hypothetical protein